MVTATDTLLCWMTMDRIVIPHVAKRASGHRWEAGQADKIIKVDVAYRWQNAYSDTGI
jgi:hypothetical protein